MNKFKYSKKKIFIIATVMLLVLCSALPIFADGFNDNSWYNPNEILTSPPTLPSHNGYYFIIEYDVDGVTHTYETVNTSNANNVNVIFGSGDNYYVNFGSTKNDIVQYYNSDGWRIRLVNGDTIELSHEDIRMKLVVLSYDILETVNFLGWFNDNFTEIIPPSITNADISVSFIEILTSGISNLASGIGSGVNSFVGDLFLNVSGNGLSTFGFVVAIFGGLALAVGLTKLIFEWIRSIGN